MTDGKDTPETLKKKIVQLTAKLWDAEKKISYLHSEKSKQDTKFRAVKRAAQLETVLHKVKSEVDFRVEQAVTRRLSLEVEDQTTVERHRAERAEEELKQLKEALLNKDREIDYLQGAKKIWQKRAKEAEEVAQHISNVTASVKPGGETGFTAFQSLHAFRGSNAPSPEGSVVSSPTRAGTQGYSSKGAMLYSPGPATALLSSAGSERREETGSAPAKAQGTPGGEQGKDKGEVQEHHVVPNPPTPGSGLPGGKAEVLLLEDVAEKDEDEYEESGTQDLDEGEGEVSDLFASQRFLEDDDEDTMGLIPNGEGSLRGGRRREGPVEPLSFQEAYELSQQHHRPPNRLKQVFNSLIFLNSAEGDWRKNRDAIDGKISKWADRAAVLGCTGAFCAVAQNELLFMNEQPSNATVDTLKLANLVLTGLSAICIFQLCKLTVLFHRVSMHMTRGWPLDLDVHVINVLKETSFLWEMVLVLPHVPPGVTFELGGSNMGNFVLYRGEMVGCLYNTLRSYLLWRVIKHRMLDAYPKRHTVATYTQTELQSSFAVKVMFDGWFAAFYVAHLWLFLMVVLGYWYRSAEITACFFESATHSTCDETEATQWTSDGVNFFEKTNDFYISNAAWAMFVTATSVGYGDIFPTTHLGRLVASISALVGIVLVALLTAALAHGLTFTPEQHIALSLLEREKARLNLVEHAVKLIVHWWKLRTEKITRTTKTAQKMYRLRTEFRRIKLAGQEDMDSFMVDTVKVNQLSALMLRTREKFEEVEDLISGKKAVELPPSPDLHAQDALPLQEQQQPQVRGHTASMKGRTASGGNGLYRSDTEHRRRRFGPGKFARQDRIGKRRFDPNKWKRSREKVEVERRKMSKRAAIVAVVGIILPIIQNELIYQKVNPTAPEVELFKALNTICTAVLLFFIFKIHHMTVLFNRVGRHLDYGQPLETERELSEVVKQKKLWAEMIFCGLHLPPFITFEFGSMQLDNYVMYRGESIMCFINTLRLYLLCRVLRDAELQDLPRVHTVQRFTGVEIGYVFALKRVFNSLLAVWYIAWLWAGTIFVLGYWFRIGEFSACRLDHFKDPKCSTKEALEWTLFGSEIEANNMLYIQNAIWTMWVTGTTVGYGDIFPITHVGRIVAAASSGLGLIIAALFTASLSNSLVRSPQEEAALNLLRRNKAKQDVLVKAVNLVQIWWRKYKGKRIPWRHRRTNPYKAMHEFSRTKIMANAELNSMKNISGQLTDLHREGKYLLQYVDEMHDRTEQALLTIVRAAKEAQDTQHFLQNLPEHPLSRGGSRGGSRTSSLPRETALPDLSEQAEGGDADTQPRRRKSLVGEEPRRRKSLVGNEPRTRRKSLAPAGDEPRNRRSLSMDADDAQASGHGPGGRPARPRRTSVVEFFGDGRTASVTTFY